MWKIWYLLHLSYTISALPENFSKQIAHSFASLKRMSPKGKCFIDLNSIWFLWLSRSGMPNLPSLLSMPTVMTKRITEHIITNTLKLTIDPKIKSTILVEWMNILSGWPFVVWYPSFSKIYLFRFMPLNYMMMKLMFIANWKKIRPMLFATNSFVLELRSIVTARKTVKPATTNMSSVRVSHTHCCSFLE